MFLPKSFVGRSVVLTLLFSIGVGAKVLATPAEDARRIGAWWNQKADPRWTIMGMQKAISLDPKDAYAYVELGIGYGELGQYQKEIDNITKALSLDPNFTRTNDARAYAAREYEARGVAYCMVGQIERGLDDFNKSISLNSKSAYTYNDRGAAYNHLGQYQKGIDDCTKAILGCPPFSGQINFYEAALRSQYCLSTSSGDLYPFVL